MQKLIKKFPNHPGVYIFRGPKREVFYIGKATSLKNRVASYFRRDLMETRGPIITGMVEAAKTVDFIENDSVLEALILEASLIKKHQPLYNTKEKDNKSFNYVVITKEDFPRVLTMRGRELETLLSTKNYHLQTTFGPFPQGNVLREALSIVRKIFPFRDKCKIGQGKPCFNAQIGLCPGVCAGAVLKTEYAKNIQRIKLFFEGKKKNLIKGLERDMKLAARNQKFEEAGRIKKMLFALNHIQDVALLKAGFGEEISKEISFRIEAYDAAHISGTNVVGVMTVIEDGEPKKSDYRKFKIKTSTNDDNASLREVLERRFNHPEWSTPKLIVVDGGKAQVNTAEQALKEWGLAIPVVGVVKDERHKPKGFVFGESAKSALEHLKLRADFSSFERTILLANSEAHRFAISFHRALRSKMH